MSADAFLFQEGVFMNIVKSIRGLSKLEKGIWISSLILIVSTFVLFKTEDYLTVLASLIGATALIFVGKGDALGQFLTIVFAVLYSIVSFQCRYYGEMLTYLGMTLPSAAVAMVNWLKHPYAEREVKVNVLHRKQWFFLGISAVIATAVFGVALEKLGTANLLFSVISITTSYFASMLVIYRSPYYAVAYALNDIVLIVLWVLVTREDINYLPMIICFVVFLANDIYGFCNWRLMKERQREAATGRK